MSVTQPSPPPAETPEEAAAYFIKNNKEATEAIFGSIGLKYLDYTEEQLNELSTKEKEKISEAIDEQRLNKFVNAIKSIGVSSFLELNKEEQESLFQNTTTQLDLSANTRVKTSPATRISAAVTAYTGLGHGFA